MLVHSANVDQYGYHPANDLLSGAQKTPDSLAVGGKMLDDCVRRRGRLTDNQRKRCMNLCRFRQLGWRQLQANHRRRIFVVHQWS